ncbi:MAG: N-carbamoylputrescine amidase [Bacilli bacterium]
MRMVTVSAIQMAMGDNALANRDLATQLVKTAAKDGANVILLPELFLGKYFCQVENYDHFQLAKPFEQHPDLQYFAELAKTLGVVLPISYFERANNVFYNSIAMIDADGKILGQYRKMHIPTGESYQEKFYFTPGDTPLTVFNTKFGKIGVAICWDQWFPEVARILALDGAEMLLYPTAIGSEPTLPIDSQAHWQHTMMGHAAANLLPVIAANRIGKETYGQHEMSFYGTSFIADNQGNIRKQLDRITQGFITEKFDLDALDKMRFSWGVFRDRRPSMYQRLLKK